ncbi:MAG: ImmA/IrrE family metallo-endopeptidase, partial [Lentisphaeria bacterium]|nr:ImmA/IrrE family metallo-endopeptidase [Lentisphaeria bacterium]
MPDPANTLKQRFGERLRRARLMNGFSLRALGETLEGQVSHAALSKYEKGLMGPNSTVLVALGRALGVDTEYYFRPTAVALSGIEFRKRSKCPKKEVDRIREEAHDFFERYLEIEAILGLKDPPAKHFDLRKTSDLNELATAVEIAADKLRQVWKLGQNPIQNLHEELEHSGVKVKEVDADGHFDGFSGWADGSIPVIVLARHLNDNLPRKRFTAAHELGHLVLQLPEDLEKKQEESLCHRFAGAFLMPAEGFKEFGSKRSKVTLGELKALKAEWGLSLQAIMRRLQDLEIITPSRRKNFDFLYRSKYKWHDIGEPGEWHGSETASRFPQLVFRAAAEELITRSKAASLLGMKQREFDKSMA